MLSGKGSVPSCVLARHARRFRGVIIAFMNALQAWQFFLVALPGWINRHQQDVIDYIQEDYGGVNKRAQLSLYRVSGIK